MKKLTIADTHRLVRQTDWMAAISLIMFVTIRISVLILFNMTAEETGADISAVHTAYEANPIFKYLLTLKMANYVFQVLIVPAVGFTLYLLCRRKVLYDNYPFDTLQFHTIFRFFLILLNFINDVSSLIGRLI